MALVNELMGLGIPAAPAGKIGHMSTLNLAGVGTVQAGAKLIPTSVATLAPAAGQTAYALPSQPSLLKEYYLSNPTAVTALVFPPSGGSINGGAANASVSINANTTRMFMAVSPLNWIAI